MRSKLFVPASRPELFAKAEASAADALSFDLEDAVSESRKDEARNLLCQHLMAGRSHKVSVVRINGVGTSHFERDVEAIVSIGVDIINLPMAEKVEEVKTLAERIAKFEHGSDRVVILVNIETPRGLHHASALARASDRVMGLQIGYADLLEPLGIERRDEGALSHIRMSVRLAAGQADIAAYDGAFGAVNDPEGYRQECAAARRQGFAGKTCIHPSQIAAANEVFVPTEKEVARARKIVAAAEEADTKGVGAILVDGQMIDKPFLVRARAILAAANAIR